MTEVFYLDLLHTASKSTTRNAMQIEISSILLNVTT